MNKVIQIPIYSMGKVFFRIRDEEYSPSKLIIKNGKFQLMKQEADGNYKEIKYFFVDKQGKEIVSVRGFISNSNKFNIKRVKSKQKENGLRFLEFWELIEKDLKLSGIEKVCSRAYPKMVPLAKKLGFTLLENKFFNKPKKNGFFLSRIINRITPPYIYQIEKEI